MNLLAYCAGFSVGNYVGMVIERRFITSFMTVNVVCASQGMRLRWRCASTATA